VTTCLSELKSDSLNELKSDNVTFDKCLAGLVPNVGQQQKNYLAMSEEIRKGKKLTISSF
jgi:hypothetical protein